MLIPKHLFTRKELANNLAISLDTFDLLIKEPRFKCVRVIMRGCVRYDGDEMFKILRCSENKNKI